MVRTKLRVATVLLGSAGLTAALAGPAVAASTPSPSPRDEALAAAIVEWFSDGGDTRISALQTDFETIAKAADAIDVPGVQAGCATLGEDVGQAQQYDPLPDVEAQRHWAAALDLYAQGAADCVKGAETIDGDLLAQANEEIMQGSAELTKATERVEDILD